MSTFTMPTHTAAAPMIERAWGRVGRPDIAGVSWQWALTPALPLSWPPSGVHVDAFAFAYGADPRRRDSMLVTAPWARLRAHLEPGGDVSLAPIGDALLVIGEQGFAPLSEDDVAVYRAAPTVERVLLDSIRARSVPPDDSIEAITLRTFYAQWLRHSGTVAAELRVAAGDFLDWCRA
jgi:hypothetical protein